MIKNKIILFQFLGCNSFFEVSDLNAVDNKGEFIKMLKDEISKKGYKSEPLKNQSLDNVYAILFFDMHSVFPENSSIFKKIKFIVYNWLRKDTSSRNIFFEEKKLKIKIKKYLIAFEPKIICPDNYKQKFAHFFDETFSWTHECCGGSSINNLIKLPIHINTYKDINKNSFNNKKLLITISSNKGSYKKGSLDEFKFNGYKQLYKNLKNDFDLYGYLWDQSFIEWLSKIIRGKKSKFFFKLPGYYRGVLDCKKDVLPFYKFCLVIENMSYISFITEKIFHAIDYGCIPIYYGAPDIENYIPKECFIDLRNFKDWNLLCKYIKRFDEEKYQKFLYHRKIFLSSSIYKEFSSSAFALKVSERITLEN